MRMVRAYLRAKGHKGRENAVKQREVFENTGISLRQIRQQIEEVNGDPKVRDMISFCNDGIYIVTSQEELRTIKERAKRAIQRNKKRIDKVEILLNEKTQMTFVFDWDNDTITKGEAK